MASSPRNLLTFSSFYASLCVQISTFYKDTSHIRLTARLTAVAQLVKNLSAVQEIQVQSPGGEDPLEKKMQPTPVFLPGESHGQRSLVGRSPWGGKELDTTERLRVVNVGCSSVSSSQ